MPDVIGHFEQAVLVALVRLGEDAYGRAILNEVQTRLAREVSAGAVYATLERLVSKGYAQETDVPGGSERSGLARRFYAVTTAGTTALENARDLHERMWAGVKLKADRKRS